MKPFIKLPLTAALIILILTPSILYAYTCDPGRTIAAAKWRSYGHIKRTAMIEPFENQSKDKRDGWLSSGLAELLGDYLATTKGVGVIQGVTKQHLQTNEPPDFIVSGAYQKDDTTLKVFVRSYSASKGTLYQGTFSMSPPESGRLFYEMEKVAAEVLKTGKAGVDKKKLHQEVEATLDYDAFSAYIRGLIAMNKFDKNFIDVANIWFNEAIKNDVYYQKPYYAMTDIYGYLAMETKAQGGSYGAYLQKLQEIENDRINFVKRPPAVPPKNPKVQKKRTEHVIENRYLLGDTFYTAGAESKQAGWTKEAKKSLKKAVEYVPEDSVALRDLSEVYGLLGETLKSQDSLNKISTDGICY